MAAAIPEDAILVGAGCFGMAKQPAESAALLKTAMTGLPAGKPVAIDLRGVEKLDSVRLAVVISGVVAARKEGRKPSIVVDSPLLAQLVKVVRMDQLATIIEVPHAG